MAIQFLKNLTLIRPDMLTGFFQGWPDPPSPQTHLELLRRSDKVVLALEDESTQVIGFITAITDEILSAHIPLLEVLPEYRRRGIGRELVQRMLANLGELYAIDLICDSNLRPFYERLGLKPTHGMIIRNHQFQSGKK